MKQRELLIILAVMICAAAVLYAVASGGVSLPSLDRQPMVTVVIIQVPPCNGTEGQDCYKLGEPQGVTCVDGSCPDDN